MNLTDYKSALLVQINDLDTAKLTELANEIKARIRTGGMIFIAGNGGSAATGAHMVCDLGKTIIDKSGVDRPRARVINLSDNIPLMTAWANDSSYQEIFSQPLRNFAQKGDLLIVISGSGNSDNIIELIKTAQELGVLSFGLLGFDGGKALNLLDQSILIKSDCYGVVEDMHMIIDHMLTELLKTN